MPLGTWVKIDCLQVSVVKGVRQISRSIEGKYESSDFWTLLLLTTVCRQNYKCVTIDQANI